MKWLTTEHIQAQAKKGRRQALECSIEHWEQLAGATFEELECLKSDEVNMGTSNCALCLRHDGCSSCPASRGRVCGGSKKSQWRKVYDTTFMFGYQKRHYPAFHREAKKMLKVLKQVHKKLYK